MKIFVVELNVFQKPSYCSPYWDVHTRKRFADKVKAEMAVAELELGIAKWNLDTVLKVELKSEEVIE